MDIAAYYTSQSFITDPGEYANLYTDLSHDIDGLCRVVQGLIIHYRGGEMFNHTIPDERKVEIDMRYVPQMLARIQELDARPLTEERPPERRFVGCCRDFATLFCSMARYRGIPTRTRIGFAAYFNPTFNHDHEIAECWDADEQRWRLVDPEMSFLHVRENKIAFDVHDVPRDQFMVGGLVWQQCRSGQADPNLFGVDPDSDIKGMWFIQDNLILDLAAQNKKELLLWDSWGLMLKQELSDDDRVLLDKLATLTQGGNDTFAEMQAVYENDARLRVPPVIMKFGPVAEPCEVTLPM
jgi:Transglutaminase-like superfamily